VSVEISPTLQARARANLAGHDVSNVALELGDGVRGWPQGAPYDAIAVTGSLPVLHDDLQQQLALGGRLFVVVGEAPAMEALLITRMDEDDWATDSLFETVLPPLKGAEKPRRFVL
jgi:protein-L-isoaspartate(D-aspartate) O-methyltransferase